MYLMIRNAGVADAKAFTILGVSTTRHSTRAGTIGMFGSGSKNAIALLLRKGIPVVIVTGNLRMDFYTKPITVGGDPFNQICVKYSGRDIDGTSKSSTAELSVAAEWGTADWSKIPMAFREFVANAIDGSIMTGGTFKDVEIEAVDKPRAKAGHTAVFLPLNEDIQKCWNALGTSFLHYSHPDFLNRKLLPKMVPNANYTLIYKKGVLASRVDEPSIFDYNLDNELTLDESRNAHIWDVRYACSKAIAMAKAGDLAQIINAQINGHEVFENKLDTSYLYNEYDSEVSKKEKAAEFQAAFKTVAGENAVICSGAKQVAEFVERKGFKPVKVADNWHTTLEKYGIPSENQVLEGLEKNGFQVSEATDEMVECTKKVWALLESFKLTNGKTMPKVKSFNSIMDAGSQTWGYYILGEDTIYLHSSLGVGKMMFKVCLEEVVHFLTQSQDLSRDLQDYLFNLITEISY